MSLPDTVFIFVLALIIFGPKKLPEIGRQIGRLVGEFRRASNEFKFQIEEELRQVERTDPPKNTDTIVAPTTIASPEHADLALSPGDDTNYAQSEFGLSESMAAGQHPNPDAMQEVVDSSYIPEPARKPMDDRLLGESEMPVSLATITAAVGAQARTAVPYVPTTEEAAAARDPETGGTATAEEPHSANGSSSGAASTPSHSASPEAEIHHG